jgi:hypothetical protein
MHPINKLLDRNEPKQKCDSGCDYFRFPHLGTACVLSDVYSVKKGELCAIYVKKEIGHATN